MKSRKSFIKVLITIIALCLMVAAGGMIYLNYTIKKFNELPYIKSIPISSLSERDNHLKSTIRVDPSVILHEISPFIYGSSWANWIDVLPPKAEIKMLNTSIVRFGGNDFSRFDPVTETFYKQEGKQQLKHPIGEAAAWFSSNGSQVILQINMLGIAKDPVTKEQLSISSPQDATGFIENIKREHGVDIKYVNLDNEPFIWSDTHRDLHPAPTSYAEYSNKFIAYAKAIKEYDKDIMIMGPENCNPYFYYRSNSSEDKENGVWIEYFLKICRDYEKNNNVRLLDILSVHRYPIFRKANGTEVIASDQQILNSAKDWWDETYIDPIDPYYGSGIIPKLRRMIDENYPNTKLAITEYNLDYDSNIKYDPVIRAVWLADTLGIFAQTGVDYANYWNLQESGEQGLISNGQLTINKETYGEKRPSFYSFYLMSNFLRGSLIKAESNNENIKVYSALDQGKVNIIVINSDAQNDYQSNILANGLLVDGKSYLFKSRSITVFEVKNEQVNIYSCEFSD